MTVFMFSLTGIPPLVGFYAKFAVLQALITTGDRTYIIVAVIAVLLSLIGAFYYLRVVKVMWFDEPKAEHVGPLLAVEGDALARGLLAVNGLAVLVLGLVPDGLMAVCRDAIVRALGT